MKLPGIPGSFFISATIYPNLLSMLKRLYIQNYAIIEELEIEFSPQMNAITGETGAGKSIIVGALGLILGDRSDNTVLLNRERKSIVEGLFLSENKKAVRVFLEENELDPAEELVVRREIGANGKSRAFINDTPVNLSQLLALGSLLVDLHQQFDTLELAQKEFQLDVLDALAQQFPLLDEYRLTQQEWANVKKVTTELRSRQLLFEKESDYHQFQFNELKEVSFKQNELEELEAELKLLNNAEEVKAALNKAAYELHEGDQPLLQQLKVIANQLSAFASFHPELETLVSRLRSAQVELQDISSTLDPISDHINFNPSRFEEVNERISLGYKLLKKHGVRTTNELLDIQLELEKKLQAVSDIAGELMTKEKELAVLHAKAMDLAERLSAGRKKQAKPLETKVNKLLAEVGMPNAALRVSIDRIQLTGTEFFLKENGIDIVEFLFDGNRSGQFQPLRKVASGGELSRLMLCIKSLVAQSIDLPTMIFDEIDSGISGEAARQVGIIMKQLASSRQVICITHQPQIAGKAEAHFFVFKEIVKDAVKTNIRRLEPEERIITIAKMLSGERPTAAAMENAREMLN